MHAEAPDTLRGPLSLPGSPFGGEGDSQAMSPSAQDHFDQLLQDAIDALPPRLHALLDEVSVVVIDHPTPEMVAQLRKDGTLEPESDGMDLCGLHTGTALTERSVSHDAALPDQVHLFRDGIVGLALSTEEADGDLAEWEHAVASDPALLGELNEYVYEEIRITLLHEIGHHFGLDEDDLEELGYA